MKDNYDFSQAKRGAVAEATGKTRITIMLDDDVLEEFRCRAGKEGKGYQTAINEALRRVINSADAPLTEDQLRRILREELHVA
nr:BrnA antitoxin family protein [uncultured Halomonas sp.]